MNDFGNQGGNGLPWSLPPELQAATAPPKSKPGDGLKQFVESGALKAFKDPDATNQMKAHQNLSEYLKLFGG